MKLKIFTGIMIWLVVSFFNFGALNAYWRSQFPGSFSRSDAGMNMAYALVPVMGAVAAVFLTGFVEHEFDWRIGNAVNAKGAIKKNEHIRKTRYKVNSGLDGYSPRNTNGTERLGDRLGTDPPDLGNRSPEDA